jgi:hypothetical protein
VDRPLPPLTTRGARTRNTFVPSAEFDCRLSNRANLGVTVKERAEKALKASKVSGPAEAPSLGNCKLRALLSSVLDDDST